MKTLALTACLTAAITSACFADPATDAAKQAITANDRAFEAAYASADSQVMAGFFTGDADYITEDGRSFSGREQIQAAVKAGLSANRGSKLVITTDTVKVLSPETVVEKGFTTVTAKSGEANSSTYTAIHVKKDGQWKISQLIESPIPELSPRDHLEELAWLIGEWEDTNKTDDTTVRGQYLWARGGESYLTRNIAVKQGGEVTMEGWQVIGWDPVEGRLRSWTFDSEGGFSSGYFTREGSRWMLRESGYAADGSRTSADNTFTKVSNDQVNWESNNRTLDGDPQPSIDQIEINRVKRN